MENKKADKRAEFVLQSDGLIGWFEVDGKIDVFVASKEEAATYIREAGACGTYFLRSEQEKLYREVSRALRMPNAESQVNAELREALKTTNEGLDALKEALYALKKLAS
ncbi:MAG: hypothetical protein AAB840_02770 [Patescibacteria group bacterium]